jgi:dienelactone hydrolase
VTEAAWKRRFTDPTISQVAWASEAPNRLGVISTEGGSSQAWAWDLTTGERHRASVGGVGAEEVHLVPDGSGLVWWLDPSGDERGRWMRTPFEGGESVSLLTGAPDGWMMGIALSDGVIAVGLSTDEDYRVLVSRDAEPARTLVRDSRPLGVGIEWPQGSGGLSFDGSLLAIRHTEHGDILHHALRVLDTDSGKTVGELEDPGLPLMPRAWSPVAPLLAIVHERAGIERPAVWEPALGERRDLPLATLEGPVIPIDWFPDGKALLLHHETRGRQLLLRYDLPTDEVTTLLDFAGTIEAAAVRPDADVWSLVHSGVDAPSVRDLAGRTVLTIGEPPPRGASFEPISWTNPHGQPIEGFLVRPPGGEGPVPTIVSVHGGPEWHHTDGWDPGTQAFVDHGFAVLLVNYRGSTGHGTAFRETLQGNIGFPESEDVIAGLDHVIAAGITDPANVFLEGWSWGGYLAMLNAGLHPGRWRAIMAGIPTGDYVAAHYEAAPPIRAWDDAVMGGSPMDLPELYRERNPMTYVDRVTAPMLVIAGEHDSRCPLGQVMTYVHALRARHHPVDVHLYAAGHHSNDVAEQIRHVELTMAFFARYLARD